MKAKELRDRSDEELTELGQQLRRDLFGIRMKNFTSQLDDTSQLRKTRRDIARVIQIQSHRAAQKAAEKAASETGSKS
jgi:large subunit ribosomal protein L29